jgi:(2Fe-2S) ferredoxin
MVSSFKHTLLVCTGGQICRKRESRSVLKAFKRRIARKELEGFCAVEKVDCLGFCKQGPVVQHVQSGVVYGNVSPSDCKKILKRQLSGRKPVKRLILKGKRKSK